MKFLLLIVNAEEDWQRLPADEQEQVIARMNAFGDELKAAGKFVICGGLAAAGDAKTVRLENGGRVVVDGPALPLTESKDLVTGFFIVETSSIEEAVEWAKKMPIIAGGIEIRHIAQE